MSLGLAVATLSLALFIHTTTCEECPVTREPCVCPTVTKDVPLPPLEDLDTVKSSHYEFLHGSKFEPHESDVVGILMVGGLTSHLPLTVATTDSISLFPDFVCRASMSYPLKTFGTFGRIDDEGRPVVCGGTVIDEEGGGVTRVVKQLSFSNSTKVPPLSRERTVSANLMPSLEPFRSCHQHDGYSWISYGQLGHKRSGASAVVVDGGTKLLVTGGRNYDRDPTRALQSAELVGVTTDSRTIRRSPLELPTNAEFHCTVAVDERLVFFLHGRTAYLLNLDDHSWKNLRDTPTTWREGHVCGLLRRSQEILVAGGTNDVNATVDIYSVQDGRWRAGPALPRPLVHAQALQWRDTVIVMGGTYVTNNGKEYSEDVYYFDVAAADWKVWMRHRDVAREKFAAVPITRNVAICEPKSLSSAKVEIRLVEGRRTLIEEGDDITLACKVTPNPESYSVSYYFKNKLIKSHATSSNAYFALETDRELKLRNVTWEKAGQYHCVACDHKTNCYKSNVATIKIHHKLHCAAIQKRTYRIPKGSSARITCTVIGFAYANEYLWSAQKNGKLEWNTILESTASMPTVPSSSLSLGSSSIVTITPRSPEDYGVITCNARNNRGWMEKACVFEIVPKEETIAILIVGGHNADSAFHPPTEIIHLKNNIVCKRPPPHPFKQISEALGGVVGSKPVICGGRLYNGRTESSCFSLIEGGTRWKIVRSMQYKRRFASAVVFQDEGVFPQQDVLLVTGGRDETDAVTNSTEFLKKGFFFNGFELPGGGAEGHCLIRLNDTHVFLSGGGSGKPRLSATNTAYLWEFGRDETTWQQLPSMRLDRHGHLCHAVETVARGLEVVVAGGHAYAPVEIFSFRHMEWREGPAMPNGMSGAFHGAAVPLGDGFVMVGGSSDRGERYHRDIHYFDPEEERWQTLEQRMDHERAFHVAMPVSEAMGICSTIS